MESLFCLLILAVTVTFAVSFRRMQNRKTASQEWVGGEISWPKAFWLAYALGSWFLIPLIFYFSPRTAEPLRWVIGVHLLSWWIRGALELFMIYRWYNWTPVYGISHDTLHNVFLFAATSVAVGQVGWPQLVADSFNLCVFAFLVSICLAMMAEVVFAALFIATRGQKDHKIYFASDAPVFRLINRLTFAVCVILYAHWLAQTVWLFSVTAS